MTRRILTFLLVPALLCAARPTTADAQLPGDIESFLTSAVRGLSDNDVVSAACRSQASIQQYAQLLGSVGNAMNGFGSFGAAFNGSGLPTSDLGANVAANAYANAVGQGARSEQYAATFALGSMCNTSETARLASAQFDFVRNVVNRGIEQSLPAVTNVLSSSSTAVTPVPNAVREARYQQLFVRTAPNTPGILQTPPSDALLDSTIAASYLMSARADSVSTMSYTQLQQYGRELQGTASVDSLGRPTCPGIDGQGDAAAVTAPDSTGRCGPISPGRAQQILPSLEYMTATQNALSAQLAARRFDIEAARTTRLMRQDLLQSSGQWVMRGW